MNWDAIGAIGENVGAIGVIVSVVYLALQVRKQTDESRLAASRELCEMFGTAVDRITDNLEFTSIYLKACQNYNELPNTERLWASFVFQRFCRIMDGEITVRSEPGEGSSFTIDLPAGSADVKPQAKIRATAPEATATLPARPPDGDAKPLILAIDDDPSVHELLKMVLSEDGYEVVSATNGVEGIRMAREIKPQIITLDVLLPDLDGWSVLAAVKSDPAISGIPVVMLSIVDDATRG